MLALRSLLVAGVAVLALLGGPDVGARADRVADFALIGEIARAQLPPRDYFYTDDHYRSFRRIGE